jgi:D-serine dehydratase
LEKEKVFGKTIKDWVEELPQLNALIQGDEVFWVNPHFTHKEVKQFSLGQKEVNQAEARLVRFAPYLAKAFPVTEAQKGLIESPLIPIPQMHEFLEGWFKVNIPGQILLKEDNLLPIAGSIKARGGIYEVLKHSEDLAVGNHRLTMQDDYSILMSADFKDFFANYSIVVGSTGNLGLSIGIMSSKLGYQVDVHMSADAKQWKKDLLRSQGVQVIEYNSDYSRAVEEGRDAAQGTRIAISLTMRILRIFF